MWRGSFERRSEAVDAVDNDASEKTKHEGEEDSRMHVEEGELEELPSGASNQDDVRTSSPLPMTVWEQSLRTPKI